MKRREFISKTIGLAGSVLPGIAIAKSVPCPPASLSVTGGPTVKGNCVAPGEAEADWLARANGDGVVWAHDFRSDAEVANFLKVPNGLTAGVHAPSLMAFRTTSDGITGGGCLELRNIGSSLLEAVDSNAVRLLLKDASDFPEVLSLDAAYEVTIQTSSPRKKEVVLVTGKQGNSLTVQRGRPFPDPGSFENRGNAAAWDSGAAIGTDCRGGWARPLSAIVAGDNGLPIADAAAGGSVTRRQFRPRSGQSVDNLIYNFRTGYYGHRDYHDVYGVWNGQANVWDGDEFYLQFRVKVDHRRLAPENEGGGKLWFLHMMGQGGAQQLVMSSPDAVKRRFSIFTNYGSNPNSALTSPQGGPSAKGDQSYVSFMPASQWQSTCVTGDTSGCWEWPVDEWVTLLLHVKPGHDNDFQYPMPGELKRGENLIQVVTADFAPINDGNGIEFETNAVPVKDTFRFNGAKDIATEGYFQNWDLTFLNSLALPGASQLTVASYRQTGARARWRVVAKRAGETVPSGVPANGDRVKVDWGQVSRDAKYRDTTVEVWAKRAVDSSYVMLYSKADLAWVFGDANQGEYSIHPPGFNCFQPTGYQNVQDGQMPPRITYWYRFDQVILSKRFIAAPRD